jgi:hypothetical protein
MPDRVKLPVARNWRAGSRKSDTTNPARMIGLVRAGRFYIAYQTSLAPGRNAEVKGALQAGECRCLTRSSAGRFSVASPGESVFEILIIVPAPPADCSPPP